MTVTGEWTTLKWGLIFQVRIHRIGNDQRSVVRRIVQVEHVQESRATPLPSHEGEKKGSRRSSQAADVGNSGVKNLPQWQEDDNNAARIANSSTPAERCCNIRSWLTIPKDDTSMKKKGM